MNYSSLTSIAHSEHELSRFGITAAMLDLQIVAESGGNPWAVGPPTKYGNALGLVQFIPDTCKDLDLKAPFDPPEAIQAQGKYLSICGSAVAGLVVAPLEKSRWTFAAFNWGTGNVSKFLNRRAPQDRFFPRKWTLLCGVPRETVAYVNKIVG